MKRSLQELEEQTGLSAKNIRYYAQCGLLDGRTEVLMRTYTDADAVKLRHIRLMRALGIRLGLITQVMQGTLRLQDAAALRLQEMEEEASDRTGARMLCAMLAAQDAPDDAAVQDALRQLEALARSGQPCIDITADYATCARNIWPEQVEDISPNTPVGETAEQMTEVLTAFACRERHDLSLQTVARSYALGTLDGEKMLFLWEPPHSRFSGFGHIAIYRRQA